MSTIDYTQDENKVSLCIPTARPCKYCRYCDSPIKWACYLEEKIINDNSIFHWQLKRTKYWIPVDFYTGKRHLHRVRRLFSVADSGAQSVGRGLK
jgi:hypothetical protein